MIKEVTIMKNRKTENPEIRKRMTASGIGYGELSDAIGVSETTLYRWLRHVLTEEQRKLIENALTELEVA